MKVSSFCFLLATASGFQIPAPLGQLVGTAAVVSTLIATPPAVPARNSNIPPTAVEVNIKVENVDPKAIARELYFKRDRLKVVGKDFTEAAKKLTDDVAGLVTLPPPEIQVNPPTDLKKAARDASIGRGKVFINGEAVYVEVRSEEGFLTVRFLSPILPKLPFLSPTEAERNELLMPPPAKPKDAIELVERFNDKVKAFSSGQVWNDFWGSEFTIPYTERQVTYKTAAGTTALFIGFAYGSSYGYYLNEKGELFAGPAPEKAKKKKPGKKPAPKPTEKVDTDAKKAEPTAESAPKPKPTPVPVSDAKVEPVLPSKDISEVLKEVASNVEDEKAKMERLEDAKEEALETIRSLVSEPEKKSPFAKRLVKKVIMPWRKWDNLS